MRFFDLRTDWHEVKSSFIPILGGGLKHFLCSTLFGEDSHVDEYVSNRLKPPTRIRFPPFDKEIGIFGMAANLLTQNVFRSLVTGDYWEG